MTPRTPLALVRASAAAALLVLGGCSSTPQSTGERTVIMSAGDAPASTESRGRSRAPVLISSSDDARVGAEAAKSVEAEIGIVDDADLEAYVQGIGKKLLRGVPRRSFKYQFKVVDQFEPNAFALPGGYIFISRGLLALVNDEDELACVIGHEIIHSAMRHAARQQQLAQRGGIAMPWIRAGEQSAYARDMEREADRGGQKLAAAAGYDPRGMATFLQSLEMRERLVLGRPRRATFLDTHPSSQERAAVNAVTASEIRWRRDPSLGDTRVAVLRQVDGLSLGDRPETGIFEDELFMHPDLDFQIRFPRGWRTINSAAAVGAQAPRRDAVVYLTADMPPGDPKETAETYVEKHPEAEGFKVVDSDSVHIGEIGAWRLRLRGKGRGGHLDIWVTFIPYRGATWRVIGVAPSFVADKHERRILNTTRSFGPLGAAERRSILATRLRVVEAQPGEDVVALSRRTDNVWDGPQTALGNGVVPNHRFEGGDLVKIAKAERYR